MLKNIKLQVKPRTQQKEAVSEPEPDQVKPLDKLKCLMADLNSCGLSEVESLQAVSCISQHSSVESFTAGSLDTTKSKERFDTSQVTYEAIENTLKTTFPEFATPDQIANILLIADYYYGSESDQATINKATADAFNPDFFEQCEKLHTLMGPAFCKDVGADDVFQYIQSMKATTLKSPKKVARFFSNYCCAIIVWTCVNGITKKPEAVDNLTVPFLNEAYEQLKKSSGLPSAFHNLDTLSDLVTSQIIDSNTSFKTTSEIYNRRHLYTCASVNDLPPISELQKLRVFCIIGNQVESPEGFRFVCTVSTASEDQEERPLSIFCRNSVSGLFGKHFAPSAIAEFVYAALSASVSKTSLSWKRGLVTKPSIQALISKIGILNVPRKIDESEKESVSSAPSSSSAKGKKNDKKPGPKGKGKNVEPEELAFKRETVHGFLKRAETARQFPMPDLFPERGQGNESRIVSVALTDYVEFIRGHGLLTQEAQRLSTHMATSHGVLYDLILKVMSYENGTKLHCVLDTVYKAIYIRTLPEMAPIFSAARVPVPRVHKDTMTMKVVIAVILHHINNTGIELVFKPEHAVFKTRNSQKNGQQSHKGRGKGQNRRQ